MTTYTVFMRYYNDKIGQSVTNSNNCEWYSAVTPANQYRYPNEGALLDGSYYLTEDDLNTKRKANEKDCLETVYISSINPNTEENTRVYEEYVLPSTDIHNLKYDMIFIYDGMGYYNFKQQKKNPKDTSTSSEDYKNQTSLYFDKMKRVNIQPWFFHSTYHSLKSAMLKAEQLVDLFGKKNILIGKEVDLKQYIDIV